MNVLGIIPARHGSKRCPGKNTRLLAGKPLVSWTFEAAQHSQRLTQLVCSTNDSEVLHLCYQHGVDMLLRPEHLATDEATSEDVVLHVLGHYPADVVCLLQPTSPFRTTEDIDTCIARVGNGCIVSATEGRNGIRNGAVYVADVEWFRKFGFAANAFYSMPVGRSLDIDTETDFAVAERIASGTAIDWDG